MKQLIFVRHAKSDWGNEWLKDIDRPLNDRGYGDAYSQSQWFLAHQIVPDVIISSTATRAFNTALIFARTLNFNMANFLIEKDIYEGSVETLLSVIKNQSNQAKSIMLFGHNPAFTNICNELSDNLFFDNVPTCGIVSFNFDIAKWTELTNKKGSLNFQQFPKDFKNQD
jgi:phosphohistidine phosphatase